MTNDATGGVSKRSLVLLGGLAALALSRDTRRALVDATAQAWHGAGSTLDDRVKPALAQAATHAQELATEATRRGAAGLETLREEAPVRAHALLDTARDTAGTLAHAAQDSASGLLGTAGAATQQTRRHAGKALESARKTAAGTLDDVVKPALSQAQGAGLGLLTGVQERVHEVLGEGADTLESRRRQAEKTVARARRDAEKSLRSARREWNPQKLERAVDRKVAGLQKELGRELKLLEKQARRARRDDHSTGPGGALTAALLLGTGVVVLARVPVARQGILTAVGRVSPEAAEALHQAGRNVRNLVGSVWLERLEEPGAPPAAAASAQVGTAAASAPAQPSHPTPPAGEPSSDASRSDASKN